MKENIGIGGGGGDESGRDGVEENWKKIILIKRNIF